MGLPRGPMSNLQVTHFIIGCLLCYDVVVPVCLTHIAPFNLIVGLQKKLWASKVAKVLISGIYDIWVLAPWPGT
jgi:hypothetical protein